jgi:hypothetical protein
MKRLPAFMMALLTATATVACGAPVQNETVTTPAACVAAIDKSDELLSLTSKIISDISNNDHVSFEAHFNQYRVATVLYKEWRDKCLNAPVI